MTEMTPAPTVDVIINPKPTIPDQAQNSNLLNPKQSPADIQTVTDILPNDELIPMLSGHPEQGEIQHQKPDGNDQVVDQSDTGPGQDTTEETYIPPDTASPVGETINEQLNLTEIYTAWADPEEGAVATVSRAMNENRFPKADKRALTYVHQALAILEAAKAKQSMPVITDQNGLRRTAQTHDAVEPILNALEKLSKADGGQSEFAQKAKTLYESLKPHITENPGGGHYFKPREERPQEPEKKGNLGPEEVIYNEARNAIRDILALVDEIDVTDPEALKKVFSPNQMIAWLEYLYEGYTSLNNGDIKLAPNALARNKRMVAGLLYSHFQEMSGDEYIKGLPENMQNILEPVLAKINNEFSNPDVLKTLDDGLIEFDNEIILPLLQRVSKEPEQLYRDITNGQLSRVGILVLGARFQHVARQRGNIFFDFEGTYDRLVKETGMQLSRGEKTFIESLCTYQPLFDEVNERMKTMGIDLMEIGDPAAWLEHHNERVVKSTLSEDERNLSESELNALIFKRQEANKIIHEFGDIKVVRNMHLADKLKLIMLIGMMFSQNIQQGLEGGTVIEDQR